MKEGVTVSRTLRPFMLHVAVDVVCTRKKLPYIRIISTRNNRKIYSGNLLVWPRLLVVQEVGPDWDIFTENIYCVFFSFRGFCDWSCDSCRRSVVASEMFQVCELSL